MTRIVWILLSAILVFGVSGCRSSRDSQYDWMQPDYQSGARSSSASKKAQPVTAKDATQSPEEKSKRSWSLFGRKDKAGEEGAPEEGDKAKKPDEEKSRPDELLPNEDQPYRLESGDSLGVMLRGIPQEQEYGDIVDEDGFITLAYINKVKAAGLTASELEELIRSTYIEKKIYKELTVNVIIQAQSYFVRGEVRAPGRYPLPNEGVTLVQAVATAGGFSEFANHKNVQINRSGRKYEMNVEDLEKNPEKDIELEAGDVLVVKRKWL